MAQYEQKTDSREFEVANPDQQAGQQNLGQQNLGQQNLGSWSENSPADAADIAIRLWSPARVDWPVALTWKADSVLVYMIADLVAASRGRIAEEAPAVMTAHFDACRHALVAAKRIQTSILEFLACRPGERVGGAILIYQPRTTNPTGPSSEMVQNELGQAKPGQILLTDNVAQRLRDLPGIEFLAAPGPAGAAEDGSTGLTELMWTTPEQVALLRESVSDVSGQQRGEARRDDSPGVGATLIIDSPKIDSALARRGPTNEAVSSATPTADYLVKGGQETGSGRTGQAPQDFQPIQGSSSTDGSFTGRIEFEDRSLFTRTRIILGVAALVLVAALIAVIFRPTRDSKPPITQQQGQTGGTESTGQQPAVTPQSETKTGSPEAQTVDPAAKPAAVTKPPVDNRAKKKQTPPAEQDAAEESGGLSVGDIPLLLNGALKDVGDGKYDSARLKYRKVQNLQPSNQAAKDGLKKLDKIQKDQQ
jgi:hypothetical protein